MQTEIIRKYFPDLSPKQYDQYESLYDLYKYWNERINVISRKDIEQLYLHHVLHSLAVAKVISFPKASSVLDFGTGGGFPRNPLAIMFPNVQFHLVDSVAKKIKIVNEVTSALELENINTSHERVEQLKDKYDYITCRAVAPLAEIIQWTKYIIKHNPNSAWILLKGGDLKAETSLIKKSVKLFPINDFFEEEFFKEKYVLKIK